jgi:integrase
MKLTNLSLKAIKGTGERQDLAVEGYPGLRVRVSPDGRRKALTYVYRQGGKVARLTLGDWPVLSIAEALAIYGNMLALTKKGDDPRKALPDVRPVSRKATGFTVQELAEEFRDRHLQPNVKTWAEAWRILEKDVLEHWGEREAATITPREVVLLLDGIMDRGAKRVANRVRSLLVQLFRFGVSRGMVAASPVVAVEPPVRKAPTRERVLTDAELRKFWRKIPAAKMLPRVTHALRLLLVTGQRRGEVALAQWAEFDLPGKVWTIPAERTKSGREHVVPLSPLALEVLAELRADLDAAAVTARRDQDGRYAGVWLFPSPHWETDAPIDAKAVTRAVSRNREQWGIPPFTVHDLRRTVRSNLSALGISPIVARKVVNHTLEGMDAIYDRHDYLAEKRQALELWAERLQAIIAGKRAKVAPLRRAAS